MSSGKFEITKYESTELTIGAAAAIMPIKLQPETVLFAAGTANTAPTGAVNLPLFAQVGKTKREYGVSPRKVVIGWALDANGVPDAPAGYSGDDLEIPVLTAAAYAAYVPGTVGSYLGKGVVIKSRIPEVAR